MLKTPAAGDYRFELQRRRCDAASQIDRYTIRTEGAEPLHDQCAMLGSGRGRTRGRVQVPYRQHSIPGD